MFMVEVNTWRADRRCIQDGRYQIVSFMHKDSCGLSQLYLRYASKVPRWLLYRSARRVWEWWFKVGPAQPECMAAAICRCFRRLLRGMAQRNASTASFQGCCLASARPPWTLFSPLLAWGVMCTTGYDRLPHRCCCGLDLCLDCLRPACTAACVSWVAPTLPRSP